MKKIYLSGQIDGLSHNECSRLFNEAAGTVRDKYGEDSTIINPYELPNVQNSWADYMVRDLKTVCLIVTIMTGGTNFYKDIPIERFEGVLGRLK